MIERVILAGWGGQGTILLGKLLATAAMEQGLEVTYFPSYGAEVRGGTAHCQVVYSSEPVYSPIIEQADTLIIMNQPSYERFRERLSPGGLMVLNSTMVRADDLPPRARVIALPATDTALHLGEVMVANMVMLGAYCALKDAIPRAAIEAVLKASLGKRKADLIPVNLCALDEGARLARQG